MKGLLQRWAGRLVSMVSEDEEPAAETGGYPSWVFVGDEGPAAETAGRLVSMASEDEEPAAEMGGYPSWIFVLTLSMVTGNNLCLDAVDGVRR